MGRLVWAEAEASASKSRANTGAHLVTATKLQCAPSRNAAFMRQIWAWRGLLPDESGVPMALARYAPNTAPTKPGIRIMFIILILEEMPVVSFDDGWGKQK